MKITNFILIIFLFIFKVSFANTYNSDPKVFVEELVEEKPIYGDVVEGGGTSGGGTSGGGTTGGGTPGGGSSGGYAAAEQRAHTGASLLRQVTHIAKL